MRVLNQPKRLLFWQKSPKRKVLLRYAHPHCAIKLASNIRTAAGKKMVVLKSEIVEVVILALILLTGCTSTKTPQFDYERSPHQPAEFTPWPPKK